MVSHFLVLHGHPETLQGHMVLNVVNCLRSHRCFVHCIPKQVHDFHRSFSVTGARMWTKVVLPCMLLPYCGWSVQTPPRSSVPMSFNPLSPKPA